MATNVHFEHVSGQRTASRQTSRNENVIGQKRALVMTGRRVTVLEFSNEIAVSIEWVITILTED
ncbi:hypothetical protein HPB48_005055 [Haemaphysalis longicornis]|uniref:Uncharacterized protein n=1 Tax=Haemaphysalis longicornis TaxID=44386 RepID=A0A9J6FP71_HAELO|nr:hypothetical protein HPB48_005055 [Haemaphysalis longicornis]